MEHKKPKIRRVVLKLSGEAFSGSASNALGIDTTALFQIAEELKSARSPRCHIGVVVGGGNIWRGARGRGLQLDRMISDNMGMLATVINALALQDALEQLGAPTRVLSAIEVSKVCEPYIRRRAIRHMEKGRIVIFSAGTGNPYFSTDTAAALRASEIEAEEVLKATQVDGVYDSDPKKNPKAKKYKTVTFMDAIRQRLGIMDTTALSLLMENRIGVQVFNLYKKGNIRRAILGQRIGTQITPDPSSSQVNP
jgi:uridylate kinase